MSRTETAFLLTDFIIAGLITKMTPWEAKGFILFLCILYEILFIVFALYYLVWYKIRFYALNASNHPKNPDNQIRIDPLYLFYCSRYSSLLLASVIKKSGPPVTSIANNEPPINFTPRGITPCRSALHPDQYHDGNTCLRS